MAVLEEEEFVGLDQTGDRRRARGVRRIDRHRQQERVLERRRLVEARVAERQARHHRIELARRDLLDQRPRDRLAHHDRRVGIALADAAEQARQEIRSDRRDDAETERMAEDLPARAAELLDIAHRGDDAGRTGGDLAAKGGEPGAAGQTVDQPRPERPFEFPDLDRKRRLSDAKCRRGPAEMTVCRQCVEVTELPKGEHRDKEI